MPKIDFSKKGENTYFKTHNRLFFAYFFNRRPIWEPLLSTKLNIFITNYTKYDIHITCLFLRSSFETGIIHYCMSINSLCLVSASPLKYIIEAHYPKNEYKDFLPPWDIGPIRAPQSDVSMSTLSSSTFELSSIGRFNPLLSASGN